MDKTNVNSKALGRMSKEDEAILANLLTWFYKHCIDILEDNILTGHQSCAFLFIDMLKY